MNLHEIALSRHTYDSDCRASVWYRYAEPAIVANGRIRSDPVALRVVELRIRLEATVTSLNAVHVQAYLISFIKTKRRVMGLNARAPDLPIIRAKQELRMRVHGQVQTTTTTGETVIADIVIRE